MKNTKLAADLELMLYKTGRGLTGGEKAAARAFYITNEQYADNDVLIVQDVHETQDATELIEALRAADVTEFYFLEASSGLQRYLIAFLQAGASVGFNTPEIARKNNYPGEEPRREKGLHILIG